MGYGIRGAHPSARSLDQYAAAQPATVPSIGKGDLSIIAAHSASLSRNAFVKSSAGLGLGAALFGMPSISWANEGAEPVWDKSADILVLGLGAAGMSAALTAIDAGASVIVAEKDSTPCVDAEDNEIAIRGERGVVLCAGGYGANDDLFVAWDHRAKGMVYEGRPTNTGDGLFMASELGAVMLTLRNEGVFSSLGCRKRPAAYKARSAGFDRSL